MLDSRCLARDNHPLSLIDNEHRLLKVERCREVVGIRSAVVHLLTVACDEEHRMLKLEREARLHRHGSGLDRNHVLNVCQH